MTGFRERPQGLTNLRNNELRHPVLKRIYREMLNGGLDELSYSAYVNHADYVEALREQLPNLGSLVIPLAGSDSGYLHVLLAAQRQGIEDVITAVPTYGGLFFYCQSLGFNVRPVEADWDSCTVDPSRFAEALRRQDRPALAFLSVPNGPLGWQWSWEEIEYIADTARECDVQLIVDEAYLAFGEEPQAFWLRPPLPGAIHLRSFSKALGLAGARSGLVRAEDTNELARDCFATNPSNPVNGVACALSLAALRRREELESVWDDVADGRRLLDDCAALAGGRSAEAYGNFSVWKFSSDESKDAAFRHLAIRGFSVRDLGEFGWPRSIRITSMGVGSAREVVDAFRD